MYDYDIKVIFLLVIMGKRKEYERKKFNLIDVRM